ncbi:hypothetical protein DBR06_SOUSAS41810002, partial [Sousa chinensis]
PECPIPLLGRDLLGSLGAILQLGGPKQPLILILTETNQLEEQGPIPSHILHTVNPAVWDKGIPGKAINVQPVKISLKPEVAYSNKRQYPIKLEAKKGLQPLIHKFLRRGLLVLCQSPYSTPILPVVKPNREYRIVQDLRGVNDAVVPIHPLVANPY